MIIVNITTRYHVSSAFAHSLAQLFLAVKLFQLYKQAWIRVQWGFCVVFSVSFEFNKMQKVHH